jgi:hypothetical protein
LAKDQAQEYNNIGVQCFRNGFKNLNPDYNKPVSAKFMQILAKDQAQQYDNIAVQCIRNGLKNLNPDYNKHILAKFM